MDHSYITSVKYRQQRIAKPPSMIMRAIRDRIVLQMIEVRGVRAALNRYPEYKVSISNNYNSEIWLIETNLQ